MMNLPLFGILFFALALCLYSNASGPSTKKNCSTWDTKRMAAKVLAKYIIKRYKAKILRWSSDWNHHYHDCTYYEGRILNLTLKKKDNGKLLHFKVWYMLNVYGDNASTAVMDNWVVEDLDEE